MVETGGEEVHYLWGEAACVFLCQRANCVAQHPQESQRGALEPRGGGREERRENKERGRERGEGERGGGE